MIYNTGIAQSGINSYSGYTGQKNNAFPTKIQETVEEYNRARDKKVSQMKRMINGTEKPKNTNSILESTLAYGKQLQQNRITEKNTGNQLKKLQYNSKSISSQLVRSKTSQNAKQVALKARREVVKLKIKLQSGNYDSEEVEAAITHAQSMERAAKKKARHLEEEEMIKITDDKGNEVDYSFLEDDFENKVDEAYEELDEEMEEFSEEMTDMLSDVMEDMVEEAFSKFEDSMFVITDYEMSEDEFKNYVSKHRNSEERSIVEADAKYLKALFDHYEDINVLI